MLAYILGITKRGSFYELQIGERGITNRGKLKDFKSGQKDFKSGKRLQIEAREITNQDRGFKLGQGLQIGAEHHCLKEKIEKSNWINER